MTLWVLVNVLRLIFPNEPFSALASASSLGEGSCREDLGSHLQRPKNLTTQKVSQDISSQQQKHKSPWRGNLPSEVT